MDKPVVLCYHFFSLQTNKESLKMFGINHETAPAHKVIADITGMPGRIKKIHDWLITPERSFGLKPWKVLLFVVFIIIYTIALAWFY